MLDGRFLLDVVHPLFSSVQAATQICLVYGGIRDSHATNINSQLVSYILLSDPPRKPLVGPCLKNHLFQLEVASSEEKKNTKK